MFNRSKKPEDAPPPSSPPVLYRSLAPRPIAGEASTAVPGPAAAVSKMFPKASVEHTWNFAVGGSRMRELLFMTPQTLAQEPGAPRELEFGIRSLKMWGWQRHEKKLSQHEVQTYMEILNGLGGIFYGGQYTDAVLESEEVDLQGPTMNHVTWFHEVPYRLGNPTKGHYANIYCKSSQLIIVDTALSPRCSLLFEAQNPATLGSRDAPTPLPSLQFWSDVTFLEYMSQMSLNPLGTKDRASPPTWILVRSFREPLDPTSLAMATISYCVATYSKHRTIPPWPGVTFPIGTYAFNALMGISISKAIGMLLVAHINRYLVRRSGNSGYTVDSITIFLIPGDDENEEQLQRPSLLYHIGRLEPNKSGLNLRDVYQDNKNAGLEMAGAGIGRAPPRPVTPVMTYNKFRGYWGKKGERGSKCEPRPGDIPDFDPQVGSSK